MVLKNCLRNLLNKQIKRPTGRNLPAVAAYIAAKEDRRKEYVRTRREGSGQSANE